MKKLNSLTVIVPTVAMMFLVGACTGNESLRNPGSTSQEQTSPSVQATPTATPTAGMKDSQSGRSIGSDQPGSGSETGSGSGTSNGSNTGTSPDTGSATGTGR